MRIFVLVALLFSNIAMGQSLGDSSRSIRSRGMGGVYIPFVRGADAVFANPAALGKGGLLDIKLLDLSVGANTYLVEHVSDFQAIDANNPSTFNQFYGKKLWAQAVGKVAVALPFMALGYVNDTEISAELHNPAFPMFETYFRNDDAFYLGSSVSIGPGSYLGMSVKRVNRWGGNLQELSVSDLSSSSTLQDIGRRFDNKGTGYGLDLAVMTELPAPVFKPTLSLVWQDVGSTAFKQTAGSDAPPHIEQNLTFGAGLGVDLPGLDWVIGLEARHLLEPNIELGKKIHVGTEISLPIVDLRAGYSQGYLSYGAGVNFLIFQLDAVSYTEETGFYPGQSGDPRYMVSLSFDLSFDADFKFTDNNGKKRKLKQRR